MINLLLYPKALGVFDFGHPTLKDMAESVKRLSAYPTPKEA